MTARAWSMSMPISAAAALGQQIGDPDEPASIFAGVDNLH
jgi:hypothetical protein